MPKLLQIAGVMDNIGYELLMSYITTTFPNMIITQLIMQKQNQWQFVLSTKESVSFESDQAEF